MTSVGRVVSLVPSLTELVSMLGAADRLAGVTSSCTHETAAVVGGSKFFDPEAVLELYPDIVLANTEENHPDRLARLREAHVEILETFPRTVADARGMILEVASALEVDGTALVADLDDAASEAAARRPASPVPALTLIWRKPWMGVGPGTYVDDLLATCGFANVLAGAQERYPMLDAAPAVRPELVLLPSEPYPFTEADLPALQELVGDVPHELVDGELLTWHGPRTAAALRTLSRLAGELVG